MQRIPETSAIQENPSLELNNTNQDSFLPPVHEEIETSIRKEGISFIFESRSVSAVLNFIYTPLDGTCADIDLEINNAENDIPNIILLEHDVHSSAYTRLPSPFNRIFHTYVSFVEICVVLSPQNRCHHSQTDLSCSITSLEFNLEFNVLC